MDKIKKASVCLSRYAKLRANSIFLNSSNNFLASDSIVLYDTSIGTDNLGDQIIMRYCLQTLDEFLNTSSLKRVATHLPASQTDIEDMRNARAVIVCGTNFLCPKMELRSVWKFDDSMIAIPNMLLLGVGWGEYGRTTPFTRFFLQKLLRNGMVHSVRDSYTESMLRKIGVDNVLNTSCVTLWGLDKICDQIPVSKSDNVIFTVTGYKNNKRLDKYLYNLLLRLYKEVYFWPQGNGDLQYLSEICDLTKINVLERTMESYDRLLAGKNIDYVGSRLHGGIHAIHNKKRTIIVAVDNRAAEIHKDTGIPVISDSDVENELESMVMSEWNTKIQLNNFAIGKWKTDLKNALNIGGGVLDNNFSSHVAFCSQLGCIKEAA